MNQRQDAARCEDRFIETRLPDALAQALVTRDPRRKANLARAVFRRLVAGRLSVAAGMPRVPVEMGRPALPALVAPSRVPKRRLGTPEGHAALVHAIAHIEFNAINLALDAAHRFVGLPVAFYRDWVRVAAEEAVHFGLLADHLETLGYRYGDFEAHAGLSRMADDTAHDPMVRMALVPRVLEARGLDVTPAMRTRLEARGDARGVAILDVIARDEVGHVAVGSRWFRRLALARGHDPEPLFMRLLTTYMRARPKPPFHVEARRRAGFSERELDWLDAASRT